MSMVSLKRFLPAAFERLDKSQHTRDRFVEKQVTTILQELMPQFSGLFTVSFRHSTIVIYTESVTLKYKIHTSKENIFHLIAEKLPAGTVASIIFSVRQS